ncbi:NAD(P)H-hydrate dehydratase [Chlorobium sp. BLA1]|uniref:NAD(P)H-hydrate dehydratase n=1 Tax=Candidatus Chlorobium masyuteum TaxID=2716876 RepID=UPI001424A24D|nr:NAD(P)H-hydrate dehydratase [Candidatus Chlorobium masyuteum]NHQ60934.1 NAD(P)H-hydrate dehydratase [Candidatus Chlorobium masyuteum]
MLPVLTALEMQKADRKAIEELHIGETRLMELAGRECLRMISETLHRDSLAGTSFLVVAGKGNNGGDGFVLARHLLNLDASVDLVLLYPESLLNGVNREGLAILKAYETFDTPLRIFHSLEEALPFAAEGSYDALVDAITGTGLRLEAGSMELAAPLSSGIELLNALRIESGAPVIAVDIPSGLDATTGRAATPVVVADATVTMAFLKTGFFLNEGPKCSGELHVAEISIPGFLAEHACARLTDKEFAAEQFILREPSSAKHTNGRVLIIAGSQSTESSMLGAAILAARGALKTGAGYVAVSMPIALAGAMHTALPEVVVIGRDMDSITKKARWADTILIGCGLGRDKSAVDLVATLLETEDITNKKLILDADALYALSVIGTACLLNLSGEVLLTPHYGEISRLCGISTEEIARNPIETAKAVAGEREVNLLLKGIPTVIAGPDGAVMLNTSGTEALASAGTGDLLAGMIAALAAKGASLFDAAGAGAWFHGRAGDLAGDISSLVSSGMVADAIQLAIGEIFEVESEE